MVDESSTSPRQFILSAVDAALNCSILEAMLQVADVDALRAILGSSALEDADLSWTYPLTPAQLQAVKDRFGVTFEPEGRETWLSAARSIGVAPYLIHTGYELALMLDGVKPLAKFSSAYPVEADDFPDEALFDPHVKSGLFVKRVVDEPFERPIRGARGRVVEGARWILFARRGEEWRIDAHLLLQEQSKHVPWNETLERLEGTLLGYTDQQNDWWLSHRRQHSASGTFTDQTAYVAVSAEDLAWIRDVGERALPPGKPRELLIYGSYTSPQHSAFESQGAPGSSVALVRFGLLREFTAKRDCVRRGEARCYLVTSDEVSALNRALTSAVQVVMELAS